MYAGCAVRLNVGPVIPGAAARAADADISVAAATSRRSGRPVEIAVASLEEFIAALPS
jgi:hypothetical protein